MSLECVSEQPYLTLSWHDFQRHTELRATGVSLIADVTKRPSSASRQIQRHSASFVFSFIRTDRALPSYNALSISPMLSVRNGAKAVEFYKSAFGAGELFRYLTARHLDKAELERSLIVERVKAGLRNARAKGKRLGRPGFQFVRRRSPLTHWRMKRLGKAHLILCWRD